MCYTISRWTHDDELVILIVCCKVASSDKYMDDEGRSEENIAFYRGKIGMSLEKCRCFSVAS